MSFAKGFKEGFHEFGTFVTNVVNLFLLSIVFVFGIGVPSALGKLVGKKFLNVEPKGESNWMPYGCATEALERYEKQY